MSNIRKLIDKKKAFYDSIVSVQCPILGDAVYFRADGFKHLINKSHGKRRKIDEQYLKLMCVTHAPDIIRDCTLIVETRQVKIPIKGKQKLVTTYELIDGKKRNANVAVIVWKIGSTGKYRFRSVKKISDTRYNKKAPKPGA